MIVRVMDNRMALKRPFLRKVKTNIHSKLKLTVIRKIHDFDLLRLNYVTILCSAACVSLTINSLSLIEEQFIRIA